MSKKKKSSINYKKSDEPRKGGFTLMHRIVSLIIVLLTIVSLVMTFGFR